MRLLDSPLRHLAGGALCALTLAGCSEQLSTGPGSDAATPLSPTAASRDLQATPPGYIRIGVVPAAAQVSVGGNGDFEIVNKATGAVLLTGSGEQVEVSLDASAVLYDKHRLQTACASESRRDEWAASAEALGYRYKELTGTETGPDVYTYEFVAGANCWRLLLGEYPYPYSWSVRNTFRNNAIAQGLAGGDSFWKRYTWTLGATQYHIQRGADSWVSDDLLLVRPLTGMVTIEGAPYRGVAEVAVNGGGTLAGINELPLEVYLYGVVPNELPPVPYGEPEAQKAQAVAARTYALANMGKHRGNGYDLLPTTGDQVYRGYSTEHPASSAAVDETRGVVAVHDGTLITTFYHSTSGGYTANSEDVYANPIAYLRGVPDAQRGEAFAHVPSLEVFKRHANPTNLRAAAEGDFEADWSRYHRWTVEWTAEEMAQALSAGFGRSVTEVTSITVTDRADQGRVREIRFDTDAGPLFARKDAIRWTLQYFTSGGALASLRSTLFYIEPVVDPRTKAVTGWKAWGGGWGHGVGMSQTGAVGMAEKGATYEEILKHYYQGIELETRSY